MRTRLKGSPVGRALTRIGKGTLSAANTVALRLYLASEARKSQDSRPPAQTSLRTGLVAHVYYPDLFPEILACRSHLPDDAVCHITAPEEAAESLRPLIGALGDVTLTVVENRGRDIAPFLGVLQSGALDGLDAVLKIHAKRSTHLSHGDLLRRAMLTSLAGRPDIVDGVLKIMDDPSVGMVGWRRVFLTAQRHWHTNRDRVEALLARLDPPPRPQLAFFGGSMFWFRPAALASIARLLLVAADFDAEEGQIDGTLHHALERCFALAATASGYQICDTHGRVLLPPGGDAPLSRGTSRSADGLRSPSA